MVAGGERFPKSLRLRSRAEFLRVQDKGRRVVSGPFVALALPNGGQDTRLGITVSSKVGNAVMRVRIRRRVRELFRRRRAQLPKGLDVVLVARESARRADFGELARAFDAIASQLQGLFS